MRTENALKNSIVEITPFFLIMILGLVRVSVITNNFGKDFYGFTATILSYYTYIFILEGGLTPLLNYHLQKPVKDKNAYKINAIFNGARRSFNVMGSIILALIVVAAFYVSSREAVMVDSVYQSVGYMTTVGILIGLPIVLDYFMYIPYSGVLVASQEFYIESFVINLSKVLRLLLEIAVIMLFHSLLGSLIIVVLITLAHNIILMSIIKKRYHMYFNVTKDADYTPLKDIKHYLNFQIAQSVNVGIDGVLIFEKLGNIGQYYYGVYRLITLSLGNAARKFLMVNSTVLGNMFLDDITKERKKTIYTNMHLIAVVISYVFCICFIVVVKPFMDIWQGDPKLQDTLLALSFTLLLLTEVIKVPVITVITAQNMYQSLARYINLATLVNIVLSIILINIIGISGVVFATTLSYILVNTTIYDYKVLKVKFDKQLYLKLFRSKIIHYIIITIIGIIYFKYIPQTFNDFFVSNNLARDYLMIGALGLTVFVLTTVVVTFIFTRINSDFKIFIASLVMRITKKVSRN